MNSDQTLLTPNELKQLLPATKQHLLFVENARQQIHRILNFADPRTLLIVGPCSIHDLQSAREYAIKLQRLSKEVEDVFLVVMRTYFEKPRTALGWKGLLYDPHLDGSNDVMMGMRLARECLLTLTDLGVPTACEFLDPASANYFGEFVSWGCIGARTAASQTHRQLASGLPLPMAIKNSTDGNLDIAISGVISAASPHTFIGMNDAGRVAVYHTKGNSDVHIVLRGGVARPNYDAGSIEDALDRLERSALPQRLLVDCSHDNSRRQHEQQGPVFQNVIHQIAEGNNKIRGLLLESHLFGGNQHLTRDHSKLKYGVSLTDPCLDWESTERLIRWGHKVLRGESQKMEIGRENGPCRVSHSSVDLP